VDGLSDESVPEPEDAPFEVDLASLLDFAGKVAGSEGGFGERLGKGTGLEE